MEMATSLAREKEIDVNSNLKKQGMRSDQTVVIKKILIDTSKDIIVAAFAESDQANLLASKWSFLIGKDSVCIAKAVEDHETWVLRDQFKVLLFILLVEMTAHDLGTLLKKAGGKTCIINRSLGTGNRICCAVVGFEFDNDLKFVFCTELILGSIRLSWTRMDLVQCKRYEKFGHSALECNAPVATISKSLKKPFIRVVSNERCLQLVKLYKKKSVPISHPAVFGSKSWAQMVSLVGSFNGFHFASGSSSSLSGTSGLNNGIPSISVNNSSLDAHLVSLEQSLELLTDQQHGIGAASFNFPPKVSATLIATKEDLIVDIVIDNSGLVLSSSSSASPSISTLGLSSSKVLTTKIGCLESKLVALEASIGSVLAKLKLICADLSLLAFFSSQ
ncbi:hypothetical protein G9A89_005022 [Geosiphon pyriformis]|nr:hypothetical protein G9A89_005022 [Geosiphon pyriformis]